MHLNIYQCILALSLQSCMGHTDMLHSSSWHILVCFWALLLVSEDCQVYLLFLCLSLIYAVCMPVRPMWMAQECYMKCLHNWVSHNWFQVLPLVLLHPHTQTSLQKVGKIKSRFELHALVTALPSSILLIGTCTPQVVNKVLISMHGYLYILNSTVL